MSDMNTHPEHSRQYLRAILIEFYLRREHKALSEPLGPAAARAVENVLRAVGVPVPLPNGAVSPGVSSLLSWNLTQPPQRHSA